MEHKEIELRSEELQDVMGKVPPWILRWGIAALFGIVIVLLTGSAFFAYPDVIQAPITLTGSTPPAGIVAFSSGKLDMMRTVDNQILPNMQGLADIITEEQSLLARFVLPMKKIFRDGYK